MEQFVQGAGKLLKMVQGYRETQILFAALHLNLFSYLSEYSTTEILAEKVKANQGELAVILERLTVAGLLEKEEKAYRNTPETEIFLNRSSSKYLGTYLTCWEAGDWNGNTRAESLHA